MLKGREGNGLSLTLKQVGESLSSICNTHKNGMKAGSGRECFWFCLSSKIHLT